MRADHGNAEQLLHGDEGDAGDQGREQDTIDLGVMLVGQEHRALLREELAAADLDLHAADPAHAPDDGLCPAMQQAAQQHRRRNRHHHDADQRRQHGEGVEIEVEGKERIMVRIFVSAHSFVKTPARRTKSATASSSARAVGERPRPSRVRSGRLNRPGQGTAQHLAALAEGRGGDLFERREVGQAFAGRPRRQVGDGGGDLGRRHEGGGRDVEQPPHLADMLGQHRQAAIVLGARHGDETVDDLLLEHQHHVGERIGRLQPAHQQGRGDVVGQVGDDAARGGAERWPDRS